MKEKKWVFLGPSYIAWDLGLALVILFSVLLFILALTVKIL